jgi:anti-sigma factor RsiW
MDQLPCRQVVETLGDYLEGTGRAAFRTRLERHLASCRGCVNYLEQLRTTIRLVGRLRGGA